MLSVKHAREETKFITQEFSRLNIIVAHFWFHDEQWVTDEKRSYQH